MVALHIDAGVSLAEMETWEPERISRYMDGIAQVRAAIAKAKNTEE
jgi:hypothetical protein